MGVLIVPPATPRPLTQTVRHKYNGGVIMKIGKLVKKHIKQIFFYCDNVEHEEIISLLDPKYSKETFGINFPFCTELEDIEQSQSRRYWPDIYLVRGMRVRVTSQWYETSRLLFLKYLESKQIAHEIDPPGINRDNGPVIEPFVIQSGPAPKPYNPNRRYPRTPNSRYRGAHIGNAQNAFIRSILSSIGLESFNEGDWYSTKSFFSHRCAYCDAEAELVMDHAIPINRERLGEHRLGNLVPSCNPCNARKGGKDFREFLLGNTEAISRIEKYMDSRNYVPLEDNEQMKIILNMAHEEVAVLAGRYITIINELFPQGSTSEGDKSSIERLSDDMMEQGHA
jgi:5-methylcytosine-specific restriction endonuclease McrA